MGNWIRKRRSVLNDKEEIRDVLMRYGRGVDRLDKELIKSCYHEDSLDDHGHWKGNGHDFAEFIVDSLRERSHHTTHAVANVLIEINSSDPDKAISEASSLAYLRRTGEDGTEWLDFFSGRYIDKFEYRDSTWKISHRVIVHDWSVSTPLDQNAFPLPMDNFIQGARDKSDLIYTL
ncbi:MAG: hypothetical protein CL470_01300 [Acidimicrobiaceae bacterium]|nr:hypothetical protein [Acidimicrobiaceae bacterium]|tara:strand:+ start:215 stop:742 length:528 start_codon:yes stop_codon:yes gene_type:complete